jgi:hypothetical protein
MKIIPMNKNKPLYFVKTKEEIPNRAKNEAKKGKEQKHNPRLPKIPSNEENNPPTINPKPFIPLEILFILI